MGTLMSTNLKVNGSIPISSGKLRLISYGNNEALVIVVKTEEKNRSWVKLERNRSG